uniref:Putative ovule protein n=1 Tax=Solanum chacoense TaxID=4108 RepID=A0A0V0I1X1_SOLCH
MKDTTVGHIQQNIKATQMCTENQDSQRKCSKIIKGHSRFNIQISKAFLFSKSMKNQVLNNSSNIKS